MLFFCLSVFYICLFYFFGLCFFFFVFFFFKQNTAYGMRISDWSSDVCSSDLDGEDQRFDVRRQAGEIDRNGFVVAVTFAGKVVAAVTDRAIAADELLEPDSFDEIAGAVESEA